MKHLMKMMHRNVLMICMVVIVLGSLTSCEDFTEIQPKGKNLLSTSSELEMVLNFDCDPLIHFGFQPASYTSLLVNDIYPSTNIPNLIKATSPTKTKAYFTWDESIDRVKLSTSDDTYADLYGVIGTVANPVIMMADQASGDKNLNRQYKAEAYVLRAYFHYLLVNLYAKAYNPNTAETDGGIYYQQDGDDARNTTITQATIQVVYDNILKDINTAIEMNSLPDFAENSIRVSKAFAFAAKAQVLMNMKRFSEAEEAAKKSLATNNTIDDYNQFKNGFWSHPKSGTLQDLFFLPVRANMPIPTEEVNACFEKGDIISTHIMTDAILGLPFSYSMLVCGIDVGPIWLDSSSYINAMGITTTQMYLTLAECMLRRGNIKEALEQIDIVRQKRIDSTVFKPLAGSITDAKEAFNVLKRTLRTENFYTIWNYIDIKRWNVEPEYQQTLTRNIKNDMYGINVNYKLSPSSNLWIQPFPANAMNMNSELKQNY